MTNRKLRSVIGKIEEDLPSVLHDMEVSALTMVRCFLVRALEVDEDDRTILIELAEKILEETRIYHQMFPVRGESEGIISAFGELLETCSGLRESWAAASARRDRNSSWYPNVGYFEELIYGYSAKPSREDLEAMEQEWLEEQSKDPVKKAWSVLTPREQLVILDYVKKGLTMVQIAENFHVGYGRIQYIKRKALKKLHAPENAEALETIVDDIGRTEANLRRLGLKGKALVVDVVPMSGEVLAE